MHSWPSHAYYKHQCLCQLPSLGSNIAAGQRGASRDFLQKLPIFDRWKPFRKLSVNQIVFPKSWFHKLIWTLPCVNLKGWHFGLKPLPRGPLFLKAMSHGEHVHLTEVGQWWGNFRWEEFFFWTSIPSSTIDRYHIFFTHGVEIGSSPNFRAFFGHPSKEIFGRISKHD